ncbi:Succinate-semialdehyde dehydrogenase [NADP(+)] GabD [Pelagimonas phthalicica]|uniref:Succinate-semialdehyde dehydrogenase [NADP(+)] GabD n=1 Tax=Pelagimonas phthalicica TaxID=1037362 RepID=A0A238JGC8_9RHOB|nr:aldehyde dehydrogenase family protein [Pelagimonas phthalicica]TDS92143.1 acyl-CoA reductase-like NAD-dependent aldehyde dehydrogenase [Pelagimonas phthalicica]SMX29197.1 Succinate-semialdehyde dehydrogenase [NADP(+)] GabD [Pelagimonas phthalicica]
MTDPIQTELFIGGEARPASDSGTYDIFNPARPNELVGRAASATLDDVEAANKAAHAAFPAWAALSYEERGAMLRQVAAAITEDAQEVEQRARLFTREHGKILFETHLEISRLGHRFVQAANYGDRLAQDEIIKAAPNDTIITRQPRGVAALVVPWNWPLAILGAKLPQALMAGNTVVVKPSANSALAPTMTLHKIARMLPPGVVNILTGSAGRIGDAIIGHPHVRYVNFTGSVDIGRHVMKVAAENITPVTLELGGNDAGLVLQDADLSGDAFERLYRAAFMSTGQICFALKRLYVHRSRFDEVAEGLREVCNRQIVGDGLLPETTMGPLNNAKQLKVVTDMIAEARTAGQDVQELGQVHDEALYADGYFQRPTLVFKADPELSVVRKEQFGPVLPLVPFDKEDDAVAAANDSEFGLASSVWSADRERAVTLSRQIEAGYTFINAHGPSVQDGNGPFGGFKHSGIGRNCGYEGVTQFQGYHSISGRAGALVAD